MVPSIGIEPMTFPMSRERATAAPTGLKFVTILLPCLVGAFPYSGNGLMGLALRQLGINLFDHLFIIQNNPP